MQDSMNQGGAGRPAPDSVAPESSTLRAPYHTHRTRHLVHVLDAAGELVCTVAPKLPLDEQLHVARMIARALNGAPSHGRRCIAAGKEGPAFTTHGGAR